MTENDNWHCTGTTKIAVKSHGTERLKRPQKRKIKDVDVTCSKHRQQQQVRPDHGQ